MYNKSYDVIIKQSEILEEDEIKRLLKNKTEENINKIILSFVLLITKVIHRYTITDITLHENSFSSGLQAIYNACLKYDEEKGNFKTYASIAIENAIKKEIRSYMRKESLTDTILDSSNDESQNMQDILVNEDSKDGYITLRGDVLNYINTVNDPIEKTILIQSWLEEYSVREIANELNKASSSVHRIILKHRENFQKKYLSGTSYELRHKII